MSDEQAAKLADRLEDLEVHYLPSGAAYVRNVGNGHSHTVTLTECDCADFQGRNGGTYEINGQRVCKHLVARRFTERCEMCGGVMHYESQIIEQFVCEKCGNARMASIVIEDRKAVAA